MTDPLTTLAALEAQATEGEWFTVEGTGISVMGLQDHEEGHEVWGLLADFDTHSAIHPEKDAAFVCAARNALPALLELVRLHKEWVEAREACAANLIDIGVYARLQRLNTAESALASWMGGRE